MLRRIRSVGTLLRTVRHLRPQQITGQLHNRLRRYWEHPEALAQQALPLYPGLQWEPGTHFPAPGEQRNQRDAILGGTLNFINDLQPIGYPPRWRCDDLPKLWQYNLHYFEWLWALEYEEAREVVRDWIRAHPLQHGYVGWEPYPICLRTMNWCAVFFGKYHDQIHTETIFLEEIWRSIYLQMEWLMSHLEFHLMGNHLLENTAALMFVGSCFQGEDAQRWWNRGLELGEREWSEQIFPDGLHFERAPMYHQRMTYILLLLLQSAPSLRTSWHGRLRRMVSALQKTCHPDGQIALFNDSAFGIYNPPEELLAASEPFLNPLPSAPLGAWSLPDAGYFGWRDEDDNYIICDAGKVGPDYIPGHAHGDIFSFESSWKGQRVFVDSGVFDYVVSDMRAYCRSTAGHNTVEINGQDQCELWGSFRVGRRGQPRDVYWKPMPDGFELSAWHDGYHHLPGSPRHHRTFRWQATSLSLTDTITARSSVDVANYLHLHPDCKIEPSSPKQFSISLPSGDELLLSLEGDGSAAIERSSYCPEFGQAHDAPVLVFRAKGKKVTQSIHIAPRL